MNIKTFLDDFLTRKMDRRQFLRQLGLGMLLLFGLGSIAKLVASSQEQLARSAPAQPEQPGMYSTSVYAGKKQH